MSLGRKHHLKDRWKGHQTVIDPYDRSAVIKLLRRAADHIAQGVKNPQIHSDIHLLADHLETGD